MKIVSKILLAYWVSMLPLTFLFIFIKRKDTLFLKKIHKIFGFLYEEYKT
jgi:hypothetical protein